MCLSGRHVTEYKPCVSSHHLMFTLYFGRDRVNLNILRRTNVALKTPDEV